MSYSQKTQYLESKVLTAPSPRLHLMLIEGAIRFSHQAEAAMLRGDLEAADGPLMRVLDIVGEMLAGVREAKTEINLKLANFYLYLFRILGQAKVNDDVEKLTEALSLLEFERQTWQLVCDKLGTKPAAAASPTQGAVGYAMPPSPVSGSFGVAMPISSSGISLEA